MAYRSETLLLYWGRYSAQWCHSCCLARPCWQVAWQHEGLNGQLTHKTRPLLSKNTVCTINLWLLQRVQYIKARPCVAE